MRIPSWGPPPQLPSRIMRSQYVSPRDERLDLCSSRQQRRNYALPELVPLAQQCVVVERPAWHAFAPLTVRRVGLGPQAHSA